ALHQSQPQEAERLFQTALAANPRYKEALLGLGKAELALNDPENALAPLRRAITLDPHYAQAHYQLGNALARLGRSAEAAKEHAISTHIQAHQQAVYTRRLNSIQPHR
ncbi:MAG: tetratricopeptide repeat protein, partial [Terriglobia bacterium]